MLSQTMHIATQGNATELSQYQLITANGIAPQRSEIESFVKQGFAQAHGAKIDQFLPVMLALKSESMHAALGVKNARSGLFIEQYLAMPAAEFLAIKGIEADASVIAEIGNLYSRSHRHTLSLLMATALGLCLAGYQYVLFCGTKRVVQLLEHKGIALTYLCQADSGKLSDQNLTRWGRYYESNPQVMALNLQDALVPIFKDPNLQAMIPVIAPQLKLIWQQVRCL